MFLAGRICLINSVFPALPFFTYPSSRFWNQFAKALSVYKGGFYGVEGRRIDLFRG